MLLSPDILNVANLPYLNQFCFVFQAIVDKYKKISRLSQNAS